MSDKNIIHLTIGPIMTNCWIYQYDDNNAIVIDPGDEADAIISSLEKSGLSLMYILLTHGHFDHIGAVPNLKKKYGNAKIAIHHLDSDYLGRNAYETQSKSAAAALGDASFIDSLWPSGKDGLPPADVLLEDGETIGPFKVLHLPGHTQGSAAFWDKKAGILFTGDTLFKNGYGRTDLPGGSDNDMETSLRRLFDMDGEIVVYPGHGKTTTIGREAR
ncbi:MAG: MBL fold metallo-hydrolase [Treponema sp.]|nr:MBL fold metallo-hydrolase [Treponema sp.]MCL2272157.1 MBL fold metallo-hydrolase [Treponema sp.]